MVSQSLTDAKKLQAIIMQLLSAAGAAGLSEKQAETIYTTLTARYEQMNTEFPAAMIAKIRTILDK